MEIDVSIIIVNYNCEQYTCNCIDSIYKYVQGTIFEIIIVDNASSHSSVKFISDRFPEIKLIVNEKNYGFGAGNNIGVREAQGKYLFFLNPDTLLLSNALSDFYHFLESSSDDVVCCGGNLVSTSGTPKTSFGNFPSVRQQFSDIGFKIFYRKLYSDKLSVGNVCDFNDIRPIKYLSGADVFIKKEFFISIGGFDEQFFMYYEDTDLFFRLNKAGLKTYLLPGVKIIHIESVTTKSDEPNNEKWLKMEKSKYYYFTKNRNCFISLFVRLLQLISLPILYCHNYQDINLKDAIKTTLTA